MVVYAMTLSRWFTCVFTPSNFLSKFLRARLLTCFNQNGHDKILDCNFTI